MKKQMYGIKYPFTIQNLNNIFMDLNTNPDDKLLSEILHVILTPKGQRIRMPNFGTNLIKYIFEPNDQSSWDNVKNEITNSVSTFVPNAKLVNIDVLQDEADDNRILLKIEYSVSKGNSVENNKVIVEI